jgi:uncharacterized protein YoxC
MKKFQSFDFNSIADVSGALQQIEDHIRTLADFVGECDQMEEDDRAVLIENIGWLKRFYEAAESRISQ